MLNITNEKGISFNVRMVFQGQHYGNHLMTQLTHEEDDPLIEFYDASTVSNNGLGEFVERYRSKTLIDYIKSNFRVINLDGGVPEWDISVENLKEVLEWAELETKGFARFVRETPAESWQALMSSEKGLEIMNDVADSWRITPNRGDESLAETNPVLFMNCYRNALALAKENHERDWNSIIYQAFMPAFDANAEGQNIWSMVDGSIAAFRESLEHSHGGSFTTAEYEIVKSSGCFAAEYARAHHLEQDDAELIVQRAYTEWLCDYENQVGTDGETLYDVFASTFDVREWISNDYEKVEFPIWLNKKDTESLDTAWLYQEQMTNRLDEEGVKAIRSILEFTNVSGEYLIGAAVDDAFTPDDPSLIDEIKSIKADPEKPALLSAKEIMRALGEASRGGVPVVFAFIPSNELINTDPRLQIKVEAHSARSIQFGIHDPINGSGYLDSMIQEFTLPPGALLDKYSVGNVGAYGINGVYDFHKPAVTAHLSNPVPNLSSSIQDGLDEPVDRVTKKLAM